MPLPSPVPDTPVTLARPRTPWRRPSPYGRACALVVAAVLGATGTLTGSASAAPGPEGWRSWSTAGPERNEELRGVAALGPSDAWAVGYREAESGTNAPVAERFDGAAWRATAVPGHAGAGQLDAVLPRSAKDVWAIGSWNDAAAGQDRALAQHFDGTAWHDTELPAEPARRSAYPLALAGTGGEVWAVGATAEDRVGSPAPLAYRWDGARWTSVPTDDTGGDALLSGLTGDGSGGLWAVGVAYGAQGEGRPLVQHWDGAAWHTVPAPHTSGRGESLDGVTALAPDDVYAVGVTSPPDAGPSRPLVLHWNGTSWASVRVPEIDGQLHAVTPDGHGGLWAVGERDGAATPAFTLHRDGGRWSEVPPAGDAAGTGASLFDVARVPGAGPEGPSVWAVGSTLPRLDPPWHPVIQGYGRTAPGA